MNHQKNILFSLCVDSIFDLPFIMQHFPFKSASNRFNGITPCCVFLLKLVKHRWLGVMLRYFQQRYNEFYKVKKSVSGVTLNSQGWIYGLIQFFSFFSLLTEKHFIVTNNNYDTAQPYILSIQTGKKTF